MEESVAELDETFPLLAKAARSGAPHVGLSTSSQGREVIYVESGASEWSSGLSHLFKVELHGLVS
jgi:hypothetical protein